MWTHPTYAEDHPDVSPAAWHRCRCGRRVMHMMCLRMGPLAADGESPYRCDACWDRMAPADREAILGALGAPPAAQQRLAAAHARRAAALTRSPR